MSRTHRVIYISQTQISHLYFTNSSDHLYVTKSMSHVYVTNSVSHLYFINSNQSSICHKLNRSSICHELSESSHLRKKFNSQEDAEVSDYAICIFRTPSELSMYHILKESSMYFTNSTSHKLHELRNTILRKTPKRVMMRLYK